MKNFLIISIAVCLGLLISHFISEQSNPTSVTLETDLHEKNKLTADQSTQYTDNKNKSIVANNAPFLNNETETINDDNFQASASKKIASNPRQDSFSNERANTHAFQKGWDQKDFQAYLDYLNKAYGLQENPTDKNRLIRNITNFEHTRFVNFAREVLRDEQTIQRYLNNHKLIEEKAKPNYKSTLIRQAKEKLAYQIIQELSRIDSIAELR